MKKLVSFDNSFYEHRKDAHQSYGGTTFGVITIDGYPEDKNESGESICKVICTDSGDLIIVWINEAYKQNTTVLDLIEESKIKLLNDFDENKTTTYLAYIEDFATRDTQIAKVDMPDFLDEDEWYDYPNARIFISLFCAKNEDVAKELAAQFANTVPENIGLLPLSTKSY